MPLTEAAIAGISSAAAAGISAAGSGISSAVANRKSYKYTKKLMDYQNEMNIANWNMQNAYNSPSAQMARYQEAGLNPNLIYGSGSASAGNSDSVHASGGGQFSYQKTFEGAQLQQMMSQAYDTYQDARLKGKQLSMYDEDIRRKQMENDLKNGYMNALCVYLGDMTGQKKYEGYNGVPLNDQQIEELRNSFWYKGFQKEKISFEQASAILSNTQKQGELLGFQDWNNDAIKTLFSGDWSNKSIGEVIRGLILMLFGNKGILK